MNMKTLTLILGLFLYDLSGAQSLADASAVSSDSAHASANDSTMHKSDSVYRCLVVRSFVFFRRSYIFKENKRLKVSTEDGRVMRGRLHLISDSSFSLVNSTNGKIDTFKISEVWKINNVSLFTSILTAGIEVTGIVITAIGVSFLKDGTPSNGLSVFGGMLIATGSGVMLCGVATSNGKALRNHIYSYHLYSGNKPLRYRDLKRLYPR